MSFNRFRVFFRRYFYAGIGYFFHNTTVNLKKAISNVYDVIACFILRRINLNKVDKNGDTALHRALNSLDYKTAARLIKCGADVHAVNRNGDTLLHSIVRWEVADIVALLIAHGADVNAVDREGGTPLHRIAGWGQSEIIALLIAHGADVNAIDRKGGTPLHHIACQGRPENIALLIAHGANVNAVDREGGTPLHHVIFWGEPNDIAPLIAHGADVNAIDRHGNTPLHRCVLKAFRKDCFFSRADQYEMLSLLIAHRANVNAVNKEGVALLFSALEEGNPSIVTTLLTYGANVDAVDKNGCTPLYRAVLGSKYERIYHKYRYFLGVINAGTLDFFSDDKRKVLDVLVAYGVDINAVDNYGYTLLHNLVALNELQVVAALIKHGANVNTINEKGVTPLFHAVKEGYSEIVDLLIKHGANVNAVNKKGVTPLFHAVKEGYPEIVDLLIKHGAHVNAVNEYGVTPLMKAVKSYKWGWVEGKQKKMRLFLTVSRVLMLATLLDNVTVEKPDFINENQSISTLWSDCKVEIEAFLSKLTFNSTSLGVLSFWGLSKEKDENKLARLSQQEEVKNIVDNVNRNTEQYPYFVEKIQAQFQKGLERNQALGTACNSVFTFNIHRQLNEDCWREVLAYLPQKDLKNVTKVASLFFKQSPSNDSANFSTVIERDLKEKISKLEEMIEEVQAELNKIRCS